MSDGAVWTPRPDPALREPLQPGLRPHRHKPDQLHGWVFLQHQVWVDYWGNEHEVELMPTAYVRNVIGFCQRQSERISLVASCELLYRLGLFLAGIGEAPAPELVEACFPAGLDLGEPSRLGVWLEQLPLFRALRGRLARLEGAQQL